MKYRIVALLAIAITWLPTLNACFFWDDRKLVLENTRIDTLSGIFLHDLTWSAEHGGGTPFYRPFMLLSLAIDQQLWPGWAPGYHLWGWGLHILASYFILRLGESRFGLTSGMVGAGFFALHPIQTEAVTWISARNDTLSAVGIFGALWFLEIGHLKKALLFAILGMFSKETAVLLPLFWAGWCWSGGKKPQVREVFFLSFIAIGFFVARWLAGVGGTEVVDQSVKMASERWFLAPMTMLSWISWPVPTTTASLYQPLPGPFLPMLVSLMALGWLVKRDPLRLGGLVGLAALAVVPALGAALATTLIGERYVYVPFAFLGLAVGGAGASRWSSRTTIVAGSFGLLMGVLVGLQLLLWREEREIVEAAYRRRPDPYSAFRVGHVRLLEGDQKGAFQAMYQAASGNPPFTGGCAPAVGLLRDVGAEEESRKLAKELSGHCSEREDFQKITADLLQPSAIP